MTTQKWNQNYQPPRILSMRFGFSADHSHECYGCPICGKFGVGEVRWCEECGNNWEWDTDSLECHDYCEMKWSGDFCVMHGDGWCQSHSRKIKFTDKDGVIVQKGGKMVATPKGSTHWINAQIEPDLAKEVENDIREKFMTSYTIAFENYPVSKRYLHRSAAVKLEASS